MSINNAAGSILNGGSIVLTAGTFSQGEGKVSEQPVVLEHGAALKIKGTGAGTFNVFQGTVSGKTIYPHQTINVDGATVSAATTALTQKIANKGTLVLSCSAGTVAEINGAGTIANTGTIHTVGKGKCTFAVSIVNRRSMNLEAAQTALVYENGATSSLTNAAVGNSGITVGRRAKVTVHGPLTNTSGNIANAGSVTVNGVFTQSKGTVTGNAVIVTNGSLAITGGGKGAFALQGANYLLGSRLYSGQTVTIQGTTAIASASTTVAANLKNDGTACPAGTAADLTVSGAPTITTNGKLTTSGMGSCQMEANIDNLGAMGLNAAITKLDGDNTLTNARILTLGPASTLNFLSGGAFIQTGNGVLAMTVGASGFSKITGTESVKLGGTLTVKSTKTPPAGSTFEIITARMLAGKFRTVQFGSTHYSTRYVTGSPGSVTLSAP